MYFYNGNNIYYCNAPNVNLLSSACSGDSALAAFLSEWLKENDIEYALGIGTLNKVDNYIKNLDVREVF